MGILGVGCLGHQWKVNIDFLAQKMKVDMVADIEVDMVADIEVDMMAEILSLSTA